MILHCSGCGKGESFEEVPLLWVCQRCGEYNRPSLLLRLIGKPRTLD